MVEYDKFYKTIMYVYERGTRDENPIRGTRDRNPYNIQPKTVK